MANAAISAPDFREERDKETNETLESAQNLHEKDMINDKALAKAIATGDREMVIHAISL